MKNILSIIIPNYNCENTISICLEAILQSEYPHYEVIVVDDNSTDNSCEIIRQYPCKLIKLSKHQGAGYARNIGARASRGDILFFTDADCVVQKNTLALVAQSMASIMDNSIVGGTYTKQPYDNNFFSRFQSLFVHYAETKNATNPDYIATHALAMPSQLFNQYDGFNNRAFPILEDVEYSHRLKRHGVKLLINANLQVQHIFNFSLLRSLRNAIRKTRFWTTYSLQNKDLLSDAGTASHELKVNILAFVLTILATFLYIFTLNILFLALAILIVAVNISFNSRFLFSLYRPQELSFGLLSSLYYLFVYPLAVSVGGVLGLFAYIQANNFSNRAG